jgi:hypothetical protein
MTWMAGATLAGGLLGAGSSLFGSSQASKAAKSAADLQTQQQARTTASLQPYNTAGQSAVGSALSLAQSPRGGGPDYITQAAGALPGQMSQSELEATPGYQFNLSQGLKATQSAAAARGLGVSGAALKGASTYATRLADSTYQNQFNNAQQRFSDILGLNTGQQGNITNQFNRLSGVAGLGENAAAGTGQMGTAAAATAGNLTNQGGLATVAGTTGAANALTGGVNSYLGYQNFQNLLSRYPAAGSGTTGGYPTGAGAQQ